jgi:HAD superfamily hydrolase (TIGR01509 family)
MLPSLDTVARFQAILFDLDGTLIDSMPLHYGAYRDVFSARGWALDEAVFMSLVGGPARVAIGKFLNAVGQPGDDDELIAAIHTEKQASLQRTLDAGAAITRLPAADLLEQIPVSKPCALVTSGNRQGVTALLKAAGWSNRFAVTVTGDDVKHGKPHPEPFLLAARRLSAQPRLCLAFEDTADGCMAATAAGMTVFDVDKGQFAG